MNEIVNDILLKKAIECYELMDQTGLLRMRQALESDLEYNINTDEGVVFATTRIQIIDGILEEQEKKFYAEHPLAKVSAIPPFYIRSQKE